MKKPCVGAGDDDGNIVAEYAYDAWGNILSAEGVLAYVNPITYRGYYWDWELDLFYLQSRYYCPQLRRFISADVFLDTGVGILGTNMYAYCNNDPINFWDPSGFKKEELAWAKRMAQIGMTFEDRVESNLQRSSNLHPNNVRAEMDDFFWRLDQIIDRTPNAKQEILHATEKLSQREHVTFSYMNDTLQDVINGNMDLNGFLSYAYTGIHPADVQQYASTGQILQGIFTDSADAAFYAASVAGLGALFTNPLKAPLVFGAAYVGTFTLSFTRGALNFRDR